MNSDLKIDSSLLSHPGRKRPNNEDFVTFWVPPNPEVLETSGCIYIVADGVGGASEGERASRFAAENVKHEYYQMEGLEPGERLRRAFLSANNQIFQYAEMGGGQRRMATTMVAAVIVKNQLWVANVGDSRAYLIRDGKANQITHDHNTIGELLKNGMLTDEEAFLSKGKNHLTRSIGGDPQVHVDVFRPLALQSGDQILLCTDGLTRYVRSADLARLTSQGSPEEIVERLVDFANQHGGADNVSVLFASIGPSIQPGEQAIQPADHGLAPSDEYLELLKTVPLQPYPGRLAGGSGQARRPPARSSGPVPFENSFDQLLVKLRPYGLFFVAGALLVLVGFFTGMVLAKIGNDDKANTPVITLNPTDVFSTVMAQSTATYGFQNPTPNLTPPFIPTFTSDANQQAYNGGVLPEQKTDPSPIPIESQTPIPLPSPTVTIDSNSSNKKFACVKQSTIVYDTINKLFFLNTDESVLIGDFTYYNFYYSINCDLQQNICRNSTLIPDPNKIDINWWIYPEPKPDATGATVINSDICDKLQGNWVEIIETNSFQTRQ